MWIAKILKFFAAPGQPGPNPVLSAGEHSFPFEFRIPEENLPSTYEGSHVKYWLKAILDRPGGQDSCRGFHCDRESWRKSVGIPGKAITFP